MQHASFKTMQTSSNFWCHSFTLTRGSHEHNFEEINYTWPGLYENSSFETRRSVWHSQPSDSEVVNIHTSGSESYVNTSTPWQSFTWRGQSKVKHQFTHWRPLALFRGKDGKAAWTGVVILPANCQRRASFAKRIFVDLCNLCIPTGCMMLQDVAWVASARLAKENRIVLRFRVFMWVEVYRKAWWSPAVFLLCGHVSES
jgi:hypothetical protein